MMVARATIALRSIFIFVTLATVFGACCASRYHDVSRDYQRIQRIQAANGIVEVDESDSPWSRPFRIPKVNSIDLSFGVDVNDQIVADVASLPSVRQLEFPNDDDITEVDLSPLKACIELETVGGIRASWLRITSHWPKLRGLNVWAPFLSTKTGYLERDCEEALASCVTLEALSVQLNDDELWILERLPRLKRLFLDGSRLDGSGFASSREASPIQRLSLAHTQLNDEGIGRLAAFDHLVSLSIQGLR